MGNICIYSEPDAPIDDSRIYEALLRSLKNRTIKKALIVPPDISRFNSYAGNITQMLYRYLTSINAEVDILPAIGTHVPMREEELDEMYSMIPHDRFLVHNWKTETVKIGEVPGEYVSAISGGYYTQAVPVEINKHLLDKSYDMILSVGQVVPHEVVGMANYNKNIFVGCGGNGMINASHYIGALYGMERMMGRDNTPVHRLFDYAQEHFLKDVPILYILTVTTVKIGSGPQVECLSIGENRDTFEKAIAVSQKKNIIFLNKRVKTNVVFLDAKEFKRTWIGNKAIYRTRMCIEDGGELIIIAPGPMGCGEDSENDRLIRKYGYVGRDMICRLTRENEDLQNSLSVAAHIIHSSSDGRFTITYAPGHMTREEIESINYKYMPLEDAIRKYPIHEMKDGFNTVGQEEVFYISNPAVGLWAESNDFWGSKQPEAQ